MKPTLHTASNGLQVLMVPREGTEAVTVEFMFRGGSRYETPAENGLAHFNEHMAFKGGQRFPNHQAVSEAFDRIGAINNAFTSQEIVAYWAKAPAAHVREVADVISDMLTAPLYEQDALDRERGVIIEEINMYEDDPASDIYEQLHHILYPDQPLGRPVLGPKENIKRFTPDDFRGFTKRHLTPDRGLLVLAGKLDDDVLKQVDEYVQRFSGSSDIKPSAADTTQESPRLKVKHKKTEQTHLAIGLRGPTFADRDDSAVLDILTNLLGGTMSSRLFIEVREKRGLAYYVRSFPYQFVDAGELWVTAGVTNSKAPDAVSAILAELSKVRDGAITDKELNIAKESMKGRLSLRWENSYELAAFYGEQQLLLGKMETTEELLAKLNAVTRDDLAQLAGRIIKDEHLSLAVIGPHDEAKFEKLLKFS